MWMWQPVLFSFNGKKFSAEGTRVIVERSARITTVMTWQLSHPLERRSPVSF